MEDSKSSSDDDKNRQQEKEEKRKLDAKQVIYIRAEYLLNLTVTKTMLDVTQRLADILEQDENQNLDSNSDEDKALLTIVNMSGEVVDIDHIIGVKVKKTFIIDDYIK